MSMTPYEIRLELLKMAKDLLTEDFYAHKETVTNQWQTQVSASQIAGTTSPEHPALPPFPTETDIVTKAEALNNFVSQTPPQPEVKITKKRNS